MDEPMKPMMLRFRYAVGMTIVLLLCACAGTSSTAVPDGHYRVQRGDTLYRISQRFGQPVSTLIAWNRLSNPNQLEVGQVLRVGSNRGSASRSSQQPSSANTRRAAATERSVVASNRLNFQWPVRGPILAQYNGSTRKGIDIGGSRGTPVKAAAAGTVLYAGDEVRGYGNLILIRHSNSTITAYAHNDSLRVKNQQTVQAGETIATMGDSAADQVKLHFEIRINGKAVNPLNYLPN